MRAIGLVLPVAWLCVACGGGGGGGLSDGAGNIGGGVCSAANQRGFVFDTMQDWYLFQAQLPGNVGPNSATTPEALLDLLITPARDAGLDRDFSNLTTITQDDAFFGEGRFPGFGFGFRVLDGTLRITQVIPNSPAAAATFQRGDRIVAIDGQPVSSAPQLSQLLSAVELDESVDFDNERLVGDGFEPYSVTVTKDVVQTVPVPLRTVFDSSAGAIGYLDFRSFIGTAIQGQPGSGATLDDAFADFVAANIITLIVDLRFNGGGLLRVAEELANLIAGVRAEDDVLYGLRFNEARSNNDEDILFTPIPNLSINPALVIFITTSGTASASELVINSLGPHVQTEVVGRRTFGKPVGQSAFDLDACDLRLRPVTFQFVNSLGEGDFFDGLPVTQGCAVEDDLSRPLGDEQESMLEAALNYARNRDCAVGPTPAPAVMPARVRPDAPAGHAPRYLGVH